MKKKAVIYGVKSGDTYHYIGKTIQVNSNNELCNSNVTRQYTRSDIRKVFVENKISIEKLMVIDEDQWYDKKLHEVVRIYGEKHPLLNVQWMLDGKRGYWEDTGGYWKGKTRDPNTIQKLSESKFKKLYQYSEAGVLVKVWESRKEAAIKVFNDYRVVDGGGKTVLYHILKAKTMKGRFRLGFFWFSEETLMEIFKKIPKKLNLATIYSAEKRRRSANRKKQEIVYYTRHTVIQYDENQNEIQRFDNTTQCAYELKISVRTVRKICSGKLINNNYVLVFGEKTRQHLNIKYPRYKIRYKKCIVPKIRTKPYQKTKTCYIVEHYIITDSSPKDCTVGIMKTYDSVKDCARQLGISEAKVRYFCSKKITIRDKKKKKKYLNMWYGEKRTINID